MRDGRAPLFDQALTWQHALDRHYANPDNGGLLPDRRRCEGLVVRPGATSDDAVPNRIDRGREPGALAVLAGDDSWRAKPTGYR